MAILAQNSGLGNLINPLSSLAFPFRIPLLAFVTLRGWPDPARDEPQHAMMGAATHALLDAIGVWHHTLDGREEDLAAALDIAKTRLVQGLSSFVLVPASTVMGHRAGARGEGAGLHRSEAVTAVTRVLPEGAAVVATTGYLSRDLFAIDDRPGNFYMQGSMGHAISIGLGLAISDSNRPVIVLDGDGAALMHLGAMSTVGAIAPANLIHVIMDNGGYESTGGQPATSTTTSFIEVARGARYRSVTECTNGIDVSATIASMLHTIGPHLLLVHVALSDAGAPPRVTDKHSPEQLRQRFTGWLECSRRSADSSNAG
jgi:phosphonopyruvate decarboxylase